MAKVQIKIASVKLEGGWHGRVLTQYQDGNVGGREAPQLPDIATWRAWLHHLITDRAAIPGHAVLKYSKTGEVLRGRMITDTGVIEVICKQSRSLGLRRRLTGLFGFSRAWLNFQRALVLLKADINTARPLAVLERGSFNREAWLISEYIPDLVDLDHVALRRLAEVPPKRRYAVKRTILSAVVDLLDRLEKHNLSHRDLKASNIMLRNWDGNGGEASAWLVDYDGLGGGGEQLARRRQQLVRLAASLRTYESITRTDYARFLKQCPLQTDQAIGWRKSFRELAHQAAVVDARARRPRSHKVDGYSGEPAP